MRRDIDPAAAAWIDVEFEVATDHPRAKGDEILANVGTLNVEILTDGEPSGVHPWFVGLTAYARGVMIDMLIVGEEPNAYAPPEYAMSEEGIEPVEPDPSVTHELMVWAIAKSAASSSAYRITDATTIELPATLLGRHGSFVSIAQEPWMCEIDPSLEAFNLYGFFDDAGDELEIDEHYPAVLALGVDDGIISTLPGDMVLCILRLDPENY